MYVMYRDYSRPIGCHPLFGQFFERHWGGKGGRGSMLIPPYRLKMLYKLIEQQLT
jgi:hypothetical protein